MEGSWPYLGCVWAITEPAPQAGADEGLREGKREAHADIARQCGYDVEYGQERRPVCGGDAVSVSDRAPQTIKALSFHKTGMLHTFLSRR